MRREWFLCTALLASSAMAQDGASPEIKVPLLSAAVTLDGRLAEPAWRKAGVLRSDVFRVWTKNEHRDDSSQFSVRLFHDGRQLYIGISSYDHYVEPADRPQDADGLYALTLLTKRGELQNFRLRWSANPPVAANELTVIGKWAARLRAVFAESRIPGGGYVLELALPLQRLGYSVGERIPFNIIMQDHDHNPGGAIGDSRTAFSRFGWPGLDNDKPAGFAGLLLEPARP